MFATVVMDVSGALAKVAGLGSGVPPQVFARWMGEVVRGNLGRVDLSRTPELALPMPVAVAIHYAIGCTLAVGFAVLANLSAPRPVPPGIPILYGLATTVFAAFWMFPAMGFGGSGLDGPREFMLLRTAVLKHLMFGVGLALAWAWSAR